MAETAKKNNKRKERGVNVRVVQARKTTVRNNKVRVNSYQKKKTKKTEVEKSKKEVEKVEKVEKPVVREDSAFAEFEIMRIEPVEKPASRIVLRDVEKVAKPSPKIVAKAPVKAEVKKEELPPVFKTIRKTETAPKLSARDIKTQEIEKAVKKADKLPTFDAKEDRKRSIFREFGWPRAVLALACTATAVFAIVYFVNLASTDMSIQVAAMQSGINATYPSYIPRGYDLSDVTSMSGKIIMHFNNGDDGYELTEESSSWDSTALLNEYIKTTYGDSYVVVREQGLTLYMGDNWEAWVNGGTLYKLKVTSGALTKKQMKSIAVSL